MELSSIMQLPPKYVSVSLFRKDKLRKMVFPQALAKDLPWKLKEPRVLEILQAVSLSLSVG